MTIEIAEKIKSIVVAAGQPFRYSVAYGFMADTPIGYELDYPSPVWLSIDKKQGIVFGHAPKIQAEHEQFFVTVKAKTGTTFIEQTFIIQVMDADVVDDITRYMLRLVHFPFNPDRRRHEVLEFLFEYYHSSVFVRDFLHLLRQYAKKFDIKLGEPISYEDFKRVAEKAHPGIEKELQRKLEEDHVLTEAELTKTEFSRLFKEGAQPLGVIPIAVWNYIGEASYHNWSELKTVLHEAVHAIRDLRREAIATHVHQLHLNP